MGQPGVDPAGTQLRGKRNHRDLRAAKAEVIQQVEQGRIGPLNVVDYEEDASYLLEHLSPST